MKRWLLVSIAATMFGVITALVVWNNRADWLPDSVPTHWGIDGQPDAWASRDQLFWHLMLLPLCMIGMMVLAFVLPWLSPLRYKIEPFRETYDYIMMVVILMFAYMHVVLLLSYTERIAAVDRWITAGSLVFIGALGNVLGKVKPNFFVGIRTPWTIASETVWIRTHRLAAWLFVTGSLLGLVLILVGVNPFVAMSIFGVFAITPVFYSLWLYKHLEKQGRLGEP